MRCLISLFLLLPFWTAGQELKTDKELYVFPFQEEHVHGSSIVSLPDGDLLAAWFQGSGERKADDVRIMGARLAKDSKQWSQPFLLADTPNIPDCNPILFLNHDNTLFLVWIAVQANRWEHSILKVLTTKNYNGTGAPVWTWQDNILLKPGDEFALEVEQKFKELPETGHGWAEYAPKYDQLITKAAKDAGKRSIGWMTRIKPLLLPGNKIILPLYSDGYNLSMMAISEDDGKTWFPGMPLVGRGPIQPALALKSSGILSAYMRDSGDSPNRIHYSESYDDGWSWTASQKTEIPNTASVELLALNDGRWILVGNGQENSRSKLSLYISEDEGELWEEVFYIEDIENGSFSYPALIQDGNNIIHLTFSYHLGKESKTIKYISFKPESLSK